MSNQVINFLTAKPEFISKKIDTTNFRASEQQQAFFNWIANESGNCRIDAVAGAGKTTTLLQGMSRMGGYVCYLVFNKRNADEANQKIFAMGLDTGRIEASTVHSAGLKALNKHYGKKKIKVDGNKLRVLYEQMFPNPEKVEDVLQGFAIKCAGMAKDRAFGINISVEDYDAWYEMINHYGLADCLPEDCGEYMVRDGIDRAIQIFNLSIEFCKATAPQIIIDYSDMIWAPLYFKVRFFQRDWVLIDEAQDTNETRRLLARALLKPRGRLVCVGDECQPADTMVEVAIRSGKYQIKERIQVPIQNIVEGDNVSSFNFRDSRVYARKVLGVSARFYNNFLITVSTGQYTSRYTLNHRCIIKNDYQGYCIYLMKKGYGFRIGMSRLQMANENVNGFGPYLRLRSENGDAIWILNIYETREEALKAESYFSAKFRIPQLMFTVKSEKSFFLQSDLDQLWSEIDNENDAIQCLNHFGRMIDYPYFVGGLNHASIKRPHEVRACNILEHSKVKLKNGEWAPITIGKQYYSGIVYSLNVEREQLYFADNILTHNCQAIYGFTGADNDAMDKIERDFKCKRLPLNVTFRCPKSVVAIAAEYDYDIRAHESAPEGVTRVIDEDSFHKENFGASDFIICRYNKPLAELAFNFIRRHIPCRIEGRDIGKGLLALTNKYKVRGNLELLIDKLAEYRDHEVEKLVAKKQEAKADSLNDRIETVITLGVSLLGIGKNKVSDLQELIEDMFSDKNEDKRNILTLMTGHKSKGLETDRVYWYGYNCFHPSRFAVRDWQIKQERNICIVTATRAKSELVRVTVVKKDRRGE